MQKRGALLPRRKDARLLDENDERRTVVDILTEQGVLKEGDDTLVYDQVAHRKLRDVVPMALTLTDLYRFPTIAGLASHLSSGDGAKETAQASRARADKRRQALGRRRRRGKN